MTEKAVFDAVLANPWDWAAQYKKDTGKPVVGAFPMHVPLELIHAAGALPLTLIDANPASASINSVIQPYVCAPVKKGLSLGLDGKLDFLDGIIVPDICDAVPCVADLWRRHQSPGFFFHLPVPKNLELKAWEDETVRQYNNLRINLGQALGKEIAPSTIAESIKLYNEQRRLFQQLWEQKKTRPGLLPARRLAEVVYASMFLPVELANEAMASLLAEVSSQPAAEIGSGQAKILICGNLCEEPEEWVYEALADFGAEVVEDYSYVGRIYFDANVPLPDAPAEPLAALAKRYYEVACPTKHNSRNHWVDRVADLAVANKAQGVLLVNPKFCEPVFFDYPYLNDRLTSLGIPLLLIETEDDDSAMGQFRTRLQAFIEMLHNA